MRRLGELNSDIIWPWWPDTITHVLLKASIGQVNLPAYKIIDRKITVE